MPYHDGPEEQMFPSPFQPRRNCPFCGSTDIEVGCQYVDCEVCLDVESSKCNVCLSGWGGANYWN